jgi:tetratricopeptide (TPR) repeat protein
MEEIEALVFQALTISGFDVFIDYEGIATGDFESIILENVRSRSHFLIMLTPSSLERCAEPGDWMRREIETAMAAKRNIVPLTLEGFSFSSSAILKQLTGGLKPLSKYQAIGVPNEYFLAAMDKLRKRLHETQLEAVSHPPTPIAAQAAREQIAAATAAPPVEENALLAQQYFEQAYALSDPDEEIRLNTMAIELKPDFVEAFFNRAIARKAKGDLDGALSDYDEAIRLKPDYTVAFNNRGIARQEKGDLSGALSDYDEAIRLKPDYAVAFNNRGAARQAKGDRDGALSDFNEAIHLTPDNAKAFQNRGIVRQVQGDLDGAMLDYDKAIRLAPDYIDPFYNRGTLNEKLGDKVTAAADFQRYLDLGGGIRDGDTSEVEERIRDLKDP